jgi:hypothetical protein
MSGDLDDTVQLKDALAWKNYLESGDCRYPVADAFQKLDADSLEKIPSRQVHLEKGYLCLGDACALPGREMYWVSMTDKKYEEMIPSLPAILPTGHPIRKQLVKHANTWLKEKSRRLCWLTDLGHQAISALKGSDVAADLGQFEAVGKSDRRVIVFTVQVTGNLSKPTLADAGFTYYWRPAPSSFGYGWTRSLRDNRPAYKEWVVPKSEVKIVDASPLPLEEFSLAESKLDMTFWQACRLEVEQKRIEMRHTP